MPDNDKPVSRQAVEATARQALQSQRRLGNTAITYDTCKKDAANAARRTNVVRNN